ncbi:serine/threonine-protein kinase [Thermomonospora amylolytica]|uniref:serine/threonine-protein kinase n=1 Tax=Thermomonospora amylolytica TaxID=1411117 RepID=UPI00130025A1|nr:serine/threonine-protein kinase [Thermomonospora amylolytica]
MRPLEPADPRSIGPAGRRYRVLARLGSGGMGVVYLGRSAAGRTVAIKTVHPEFAADPEFRDRFRREVTTARAVDGGFTAPVVDADPDARIPWLVTEFLPSVSLGDAVAEAGPLPVDAVWRTAAGVAEALASVHRAGVVHGDVKPSNVLLTLDGPRLIDFGVSRALEPAAATRPEAPAGSPGFMSPEQAAGARTGPAGDVFSFGSTLVYACTGTAPFGEGPWHVTMLRIQREPPRLDAVPDNGLRELVAACMDRVPERRPTAEELAERLARAVPDETVSWLPPAIVAEIGRRRRSAARPPAPIRSPKRQRALLLGAAGVGTALVIAVPVAGRYATATDPAASQAPGDRPSPTATATRAPARTLEFLLTGDVTLTSLTYTVNGRTTTLRNVRLPWRRSFAIPALPQRTTWRIEYRFPPGTVRRTVSVDGFRVQSGTYGSTGRPGADRATGVH